MLGLAAPVACAGDAAPARPVEDAPAVRVLRDVAYGTDARQRFDVYLPAKPTGPVLFMVHGGAWMIGDKAAPGVVKNKVDYWVKDAGYVLVSANYRMLPKTPPLEQARDVARALAKAQKEAASWGADPGRFVLMGHSAGAHLVTLLNASPNLATELGAQPWRATVSVDSAALDVEQLMQAPHPRLYDRAFGKNPADWRAASPYHVLTPQAGPLLLLCSSRRESSCAQAVHLERKGSPMHLRITIWEQDLSHGDMSSTLGVPGEYTRTVALWIKSQV
ncbi:MAG: alpha/beta hydrolase [Ramlibacter sp.]|nr:alpha/beta hydrolase [Ramlibacter sp.]